MVARDDFNACKQDTNNSVIFMNIEQFELDIGESEIAKCLKIAKMTDDSLKANSLPLFNLFVICA